MGRRVLVSHTDGEKHKEVSKLVKCFFKATPETSDTTETLKKKQLTLTGNNLDQVKAKINSVLLEVAGYLLSTVHLCVKYRVLHWM